MNKVNKFEKDILPKIITGKGLNFLDRIYLWKSDRAYKKWCKNLFKECE